jgi:dTDP-glucose 4,6-dehydratase
MVMVKTFVIGYLHQITVQDLHCPYMKGKLGEVYNIGGGNEKNNLEITNLILEILGKPESLITFVEDRLGHDKRYSLDSSKDNETWMEA